MAANKLVTVATVWDHSAGNGSWNPIFKRAFNDWEIALVVSSKWPVERGSILSWIKSFGKGQ